MEVYRITLKKWTSNLFASGSAARWNSKGIGVVYSAASRSLACLENVVHRNKRGIAGNFGVMVIYIPDDIKQVVIAVQDLPDGWHLPNEDAYEKCRLFGDKWAISNESAILIVPSAIVKNEKNILLNPNHPDFSKIKLIDNEPFFFDPRIKEDK